MSGKQFAVIGLGRFGYSLAAELSKAGYEVFAIDKDPDIIDDIEAIVTHAVQADPSDKATFDTLGLANFDAIAITICEDLEASILICMLAKEAGVPYVLTKAASPIHGKILNRIGADQVIYPEEEMGVRIAHRLISPNILDHFEFSDQYALSNMRVPKAWIGKSISDLNIRSKYKVSIVAIRAQGKEMNISPSPTHVFDKDDLLVFMSDTEHIDKLEEHFSK